MHIFYVRPNAEPERGGTHCLATVDIEFSPDLRLYGLRLLRMPDGAHRLYAPQSGTRRTATFSTPMAERLTAMALAAYEAAQ